MRRNSAILAFLFVIILGGASHADDDVVSPRWRELVQYYIENEFANGNLTLRKFDLVGAIPISIECGSLEQSVCESAKKTLNQSIEQSVNLQLALSTTPAITFVFANNSQLKILSPQVVDDYSGEVSDVSDPECEVFYKYSGSRIQRGKLLASTDQPLNKLRACLIVQASRLLGPGFSGTDKFALRWSASLSRESDEELDQTHHITGILEYIHMCPELTAGLPESEVRRILLSPSSCISKIEGTK